jgi:hypothetical protein
MALYMSCLSSAAPHQLAATGLRVQPSWVALLRRSRRLQFTSTPAYPSIPKTKFQICVGVVTSAASRDERFCISFEWIGFATTSKEWPSHCAATMKLGRRNEYQAVRESILRVNARYLNRQTSWIATLNHVCHGLFMLSNYGRQFL